MSRAYRLDVIADGLSVEQVRKVIADEFCWTEENLGTYKSKVFGDFSGSLCGGKSEEEAHDEISLALKTLNSNARVQTTWVLAKDMIGCALGYAPKKGYGDNLWREDIGGQNDR